MVIFLLMIKMIKFNVQLSQPISRSQHKIILLLKWVMDIIHICAYYAGHINKGEFEILESKFQIFMMIHC